MSRLGKVQEELRQQISMILQRELQNPRIGFLTITRTEITPDLRDAKVYFTTLDEQRPFEETEDELNKAAGYVRKELGKRIRMKFTPSLRFIYDGVRKESKRIDDIINKIRKEKENS